MDSQANGVSILPQELLEIAEKNGCVPDRRFSENPNLGKAFVYGFLPGDKRNSAAFWCIKKEELAKPYSVEKPYLLLFYAKDKKLLECPDRIESINPARGLSLYLDKNTTLKNFVSISNPNKLIPKDVKLSHYAIASRYEGVEELFYCYEGDWLVKSTD
jgi:hypothetical protein